MNTFQKVDVAAGAADDLSILRAKEVKLAEQHLKEGEAVLFALEGSGHQAIVALSDRLLVVKTGYMAGTTGGGRATSFHYTDIAAIQVNTGLVNGTIEVHTPGMGAPKASDFWSMDKKEDPWKLPNCIPISKVDVPNYQPHLDRLRALITEAKTPSAISAPAAPPSDIAGQLAQLKGLLDVGALSQEDFELAKRKILDA